MTDFKTENHDKSNLVGDAKVMSDAVDREQERLRDTDDYREIKTGYYALVEAGIQSDAARLALIDEVRELKAVLEVLKQTVYEVDHAQRKGSLWYSKAK